MTNPPSSAAPFSRRSFLKAGVGVAAGTVLTTTGVQAVTTRLAGAGPRGLHERPHDLGDYGPLQLNRARNQPSGPAYLALPDGFEYVVFGQTGDLMADGNRTPRSLDGMAAFANGPYVRLVRNHEVRFVGSGARNPGVHFVPPDPAASYDPLGIAGTSTLDFDPRTFSLVRDVVSLRGTLANCAGGIGWQGRSWISCEEISEGPSRNVARPHGYCYEVPTSAGGAVDARPLAAMGRFLHEAVATDPHTGVVYLTEDNPRGWQLGSGFYRFLPEDPADLAAGGRLQMLGIANHAGADLRKGQERFRPLPVRWVDIDDPDPAQPEGPTGTFGQGYAKGGALFDRLEGCWYADGSVFFSSTSGGDAEVGDTRSGSGPSYNEGYGQVWEYRRRGASGGQLVLLYESPGGEVLDGPDNLVVTPRGGILLCEDDASDANAGQVDASSFNAAVGDRNRLVGLTPAGDAFTFAENAVSESELAGACWSPDGSILFVNIFGTDEAGSGGTFAIRGPWERGAL